MGRAPSRTAVILVLLCAACAQQPSPRVHFSVKSDDPAFYEKFFAAASAVPERSRVPGRARGGITSHHVLAGDAIARFFSGLRTNAAGAGTVIILGPEPSLQGQRAGGPEPQALENALGPGSCGGRPGAKIIRLSRGSGG